MPKCKVNSTWFLKKAPDGKPLSTYFQAVKSSDSKILCSVCNVHLSCEVKGYQSITQHMNSVKHVNAIKAYKSQLKLTSIDITDEASTASQSSIASKFSTASQSSTTSLLSSETTTSFDATANSTPTTIAPRKCTKLQLSHSRDEATRAEIIWTMKVVSSNFSASSCNDVGETFRNMFPNNPTCSEFSLARSKLSYMLTDCVGPFLRNIFLLDVKGSDYTLCFDETTNSASKKELQTSIRYYSEKQKRIQQHHLQTFFIENGKGETIVKYLEEGLQNANLPIERILTLGRD